MVGAPTDYRNIFQSKDIVTDEKNHYNVCFVAFLDILGMKKLVENFECFQVNEIFTKILRNFHRYDSMTLPNGKRFTDCAVTTTMSDSIVISIPESVTVANGTPQAFRMLIGYIQSFIYEVMFSISETYPVFLRGGITKGEVFHNDSRVFGPALNHAYLLEEKHSNEMRVIIDKEIYTDPQVDLYLREQEGSLYLDKRDGFYFINFFHNRGKDFIQKVREVATSRYDYFLNCEEENDSVINKYKWLSEFSDEIAKK